MNTIKIEKEVTKEDVYVTARTPNELSEVERIFAKTNLRYAGSEFSDSTCVAMIGDLWYKTTSTDRCRTEITIPQLAELLGVEYPLKPKVEAGTWYKLPDNDWFLFCVTELVNSNQAYGYGWCEFGKWHDVDNEPWRTNRLIPATQEEVEAALIAEARKRGFKAGVEINNSALGFRDNWQKIGGDNIEWDGEYLDFGKKGTSIFYNGKWADVREEEKKLPTLEELIAEAKSKITVKSEVYPCWAESTREVTSYVVAGTEYMSEKLAIIGYISKRLWEEYL